MRKITQNYISKFFALVQFSLTLSWRRPLSYRNLYDNGLRHERVNFFILKHWFFSRLFHWLFSSLLREVETFFSKLILKSMPHFLKVGLSPSKKICVIYLIESPLKLMKSAFYFIFQALLALKIFKFFSWLFGHVEKTAWLGR